MPSEFDRTHVLNAILSYDLGRRWRAGSRFVFFTGQPYSKLDGSLPVPPYNDQRFPPFYRVDVRLEKRWPLGQDGAIAFVFEGQNVTLSKQGYAGAIDCNSDGDAGGDDHDLHAWHGRAHHHPERRASRCFSDLSNEGFACPERRAIGVLP